MNYPFPLKFAFLPDGTSISDLSECEANGMGHGSEMVLELVLSRYPTLEGRAKGRNTDGRTTNDNHTRNSSRTEMIE